jgi:hypothetical protein
MLSPIKVKEHGKRRADAKREQRGVKKINKKLFHTVLSWLVEHKTKCK